MCLPKFASMKYGASAGPPSYGANSSLTATKPSKPWGCGRSRLQPSDEGDRLGPVLGALQGHGEGDHGVDWGAAIAHVEAGEAGAVPHNFSHRVLSLGESRVPVVTRAARR